MHEIELDTESERHGDVPGYVCITWITLRIIGRLKLPKHPNQLSDICSTQAQEAEHKEPEASAKVE